MALTLLSNPNNVAFARNPAIVKLRADQDGGGTLYDAVGVTSDVLYAVTDRFDTDETLTVDYEEPDGTPTTVIFTAKATYDGFDNRIPDNSFAGTDTEYWAAVKSKVAGHPKIAPFFTAITVVESGQAKLRIRAASTETGWTLTVTNSGGFTVEAAAAVDSTLPANYKVKLEVIFEDTYLGGDYAQVAQLDGTPEAGTGFVYFDISGILAAECRAARAEPLVPQWGTDTPFLADNFRRYTFRYTEEYGAPVEVQAWTYGITKVAIDGGVSQALFAEGDFLAGMDDENSLFSWMPDGKKVALEQPEYIGWYNYSGSTRTVYLRVVWYDITDGTASAETDYFTPGLSVRSGEVAVFPVWPALFGLDAEANAYKYTVQVGYTALGFSALSQARTYYIDREYYESERHLMYLNAFGVPETWRCTGNWSKGLRVDRQTAEKPLLPGYDLVASDSYQYARQFQNDITYRTGFLTPVQAEALQEMLIAGEVYDVSEAGYIPLRITSNAFKISETRQELHSYEITAQPRLSMKNYSRKVLATIGSDAWLDENDEAWWDELTVPWENE
jgi:hypothetical protein